MHGVWVARMESESFSWTTIGKTEDEAVNAIVKEWNEGKDSAYREEATLDELYEWYGIHCVFLKFGECDLD